MGKRMDTITSQDWFQEQLDQLRPLSSLVVGIMEASEEGGTISYRRETELRVFLSAAADDADHTKRF